MHELTFERIAGLSASFLLLNLPSNVRTYSLNRLDDLLASYVLRTLYIAVISPSLLEKVEIVDSACDF